MSSKLVIELDNVYMTSDRGDEVFRDLNLKLEAGRTAVITGPAGSGKSSLAELMVGERFADDGSVAIFGEIIKPGRRRLVKKIRKKIGGIGGIFSLIPSFTVAENITFPLVLTAERKSVRRDRLLKMLTEFSLLKQASEFPRRLTRVENSLVQFARASIANQPLIIIDEPSAGLDLKTYQRIFEYLVKLSLSGRSMVILSSETPPGEIPNTDFYRIEQGTLV